MPANPLSAVLSCLRQPTYGKTPASAKVEGGKRRNLMPLVAFIRRHIASRPNRLITSTVSTRIVARRFHDSYPGDFDDWNLFAGTWI
jgi:hypothetical protein